VEKFLTDRAVCGVVDRRFGVVLTRYRRGCACLYVGVVGDNGPTGGASGEMDMGLDDVALEKKSDERGK
jgi:hypothetical protein